jgi:hypothetical protein
VEIEDGIFNVVLGSVDPLDPADFGGRRYLQVQVDGEIVGERIPLESVPYAFHAANADTATYVQNLCFQGDFLNCYAGLPETRDIGECQSGIRTCSANGSGFDACVGELLPGIEDCKDTLDNDCDGAINEGCCIPDGHEPNNTETQEMSLADVSDCSSPVQLLASIEDSSDADWFKFAGLDQDFCILAPSFSEVSDIGTLEICAFFDCVAGTTEITCNSGSPAVTPVGGLEGCCTTGGSLNPDVSCMGSLVEDMDVLMSVKATDAFACNFYTLTYGL